MATKQVAPPVEELWHVETFLTLRKFLSNFDHEKCPDIRAVARLAARLIQIIVDNTASEGKKPAADWDNLWHEFSDIVLDEAGQKAFEDAMNQILTGHRPDGIDELLGTRAQLSIAERPGESWARLRGRPTFWYCDQPESNSMRW